MKYNQSLDIPLVDPVSRDEADEAGRNVKCPADELRMSNYGYLEGSKLYNLFYAKYQQQALHI